MGIGVDLGGTKIAAGFVRNGRIVKQIVVPTERAKGKAHVLHQMKRALDAFPRAKVGIGVPGYFSGTKLTELPNLCVLDGVDLKNALGVPVVLGNDATCFTLAEQKHGVARGKKHVVGITLGTGVGSGILIDGKPFTGSNGRAPELGHVQDLGSGKEVESFLNGAAILRRYRRNGGSCDRPSDIWKSSARAARKTQKEVAHLLAVLCRNIVKVFEPEVIVLGGGIANATLVRDTNKLLKKRILKLSKLKEKSGILGAAALVK